MLSLQPARHWSCCEQAFYMWFSILVISFCQIFSQSVGSELCNVSRGYSEISLQSWKSKLLCSVCCTNIKIGMSIWILNFEGNLVNLDFNLAFNFDPRRRLLDFHFDVKLDLLWIWPNDFNSEFENSAHCSLIIEMSAICFDDVRTVFDALLFSAAAGHFLKIWMRSSITPAMRYRYIVVRRCAVGRLRYTRSVVSWLRASQVIHSFALGSRPPGLWRSACDVASWPHTLHARWRGSWRGRLCRNRQWRQIVYINMCAQVQWDVGVREVSPSIM